MARTNSHDRELRARAEAVIPGGMYGHQSTALLPDDYPQFFERGEGAHIWDVDGRRYLDMMCAYGPNLFGYANPQIDAAFVRQLGLGDTLTGPTALMVELAETMVGMISHADWAMFCKNGTDATTMALTCARAHTRRKTVVRAKGAYHGAAPWCVPRPTGTLESDRAHQILCDYNDVASLEAAVAQAGDDLACIFAAPFKHDAFIDQAEPDPAYARRARELCDQTGAQPAWYRVLVLVGVFAAHENGPGLTSFAAITGSVGPSPYDGHRRASPHAPQAGRRAWQTRRPCQIIRCERSVQPLRGMSAATSASTLTGSVSVVQPKRRASRPKCVSTVMPGMPNALPSTTLAVLRPTPGRVTRSFSLAGTSPPNRSHRACPRPIRLFVLAR